MADQQEREQQGLNTPSKYRVSGPHAILGHAPGSTFEAYIPEEQEALLIEGGQIAKAAANAKVTEEGGEEPQTPAARAEALQVVPETAEEAAALEPEPPATDDTETQEA